MNVSTSVSRRTGHPALTQSHDPALLLLLYSAHPGAMQILRAARKMYDQNINISHPRLVAVVGLHRDERPNWKSSEARGAVGDMGSHSAPDTGSSSHADTSMPSFELPVTCQACAIDLSMKTHNMIPSNLRIARYTITPVVSTPLCPLPCWSKAPNPRKTHAMPRSSEPMPIARAAP